MRLRMDLSWGKNRELEWSRYESIIDKLNPCSFEEFNALPEEQKDMLVAEMIKEIRKIN